MGNAPDFKGPGDVKWWIESRIRPRLEALHGCRVEWSGDVATNTHIPTLILSASPRQESPKDHLSAIRQDLLVVHDWALKRGAAGVPVPSAPPAFRDREESQAAFSEWCAYLDRCAQVTAKPSPASEAIELSPREAELWFARWYRTQERNAWLKRLFPEGIGPYEQEKVVARIRRHFPEVSRQDLYKMNPGQLTVYLKQVFNAEREKASNAGPTDAPTIQAGQCGSGQEQDARCDFDSARAAAAECVKRIAVSKYELCLQWDCVRTEPLDEIAFDQFQGIATSVFASVQIAAGSAYDALGMGAEIHGRTSPVLDAIKVSAPRAVGVVARGRTYPTYHEAAFRLLSEFDMIPALAGDAAGGPTSREILNVPPYCKYAGRPAAESQRLPVLLAKRSRVEQIRYWEAVLDAVQRFATDDFDALSAGIDREWATVKASQAAGATTARRTDEGSPGAPAVGTVERSQATASRAPFGPAHPTKGETMTELWRTSLVGLQERFLEAAKSSSPLGCVLVEAVLPAQPDSLAPPPPAFDGRQQVRFNGSMYRHPSLLFAAEGVSQFRWESDGAPVTNEAGEKAVGTQPGVLRRVQFWGDERTDAAYNQLSKDAGNCVIGTPLAALNLVPAETLATGDAGLRWTYLLFDLAERRVVGSPLRLLQERSVVFQGTRIELAGLPVVREQFPDLAAKIPGDPEAWYSALDDLLQASAYAIDLLLAIPSAAEDREGSKDSKASGEVATDTASTGKPRQGQGAGAETPPVAALEHTKLAEPAKAGQTALILPKRPPDKAFRAWWIRQSGIATTQREIAEKMIAMGTKADQGQVSRWLKAVGNYVAAGGILPTVAELGAKPQSIDPNVVDMGARQDGRTPRQRLRRDPDADSDDE